jgi:hypothetical protein
MSGWMIMGVLLVVAIGAVAGLKVTGVTGDDVLHSGTPARNS